MADIKTLEDLKLALAEALAPSLCRWSEPHHHVQTVVDVKNIYEEIKDLKELR